MSLTRQRLLDEAQWAIERGQLDRAARAYRALLDERPEDLRVGLKLGELYLRLEERDAARDLYERLLLRSVQEGAQERAAALAGLLLQISPAHLGARLHLTRAHLAAGDAAGAEGHLGALLEALEAAPGAVALPCLEECARLFPLSRPARQALAERALAAGEGARAAPHCTLLSAWAEREGAAAAAARWAALALAHLGAARAAGLGAALDEAAGASGGGAAGEGAARALTLRRARALRALGRAAESEAPLAPLAAAAPGDLEVALEWAHVHRARARPLQADALLLSVGERALAAGRRPLAREAYEALRAARPDDP
ncbi:MAG: tetratricopeptide repeat protein, partial [Deltaproteobacteria bacterium]|nr:tetratricopeptide repeat protein [Deltaproteobacteria bacterium]